MDPGKKIYFTDSKLQGVGPVFDDFRQAGRRQPPVLQLPAPLAPAPLVQRQPQPRHSLQL